MSTLCLCKAGYDFKRLFTISEYYDRDRSTFYKSTRSVREAMVNAVCHRDYLEQGAEVIVKN